VVRTIQYLYLLFIFLFFLDSHFVCEMQTTGRTIGCVDDGGIE